MAIKIVTDSTSDLPPSIAGELEITVVPLNVHFAGQVYRDGVDIQADEFYRKLQQSKVLPTTSQPSAGAFVETYQSIAGPQDQIVSIHISSKLSGTINSVLLAKQELDDYHIEVVDSQLVSMGLGFVAMVAARAAKEGRGLEEVLQEARGTVNQVSVFALIDTLEYLEKGGRLGRAQAFLGSLLQIKPLITLRDGEVHPLERARTRAKAVTRICELVRALPLIAELCILHSAAAQEAEGLAAELASLYPREKMVVAQCGPVLGTYLGPGALGAVVRRAD